MSDAKEGGQSKPKPKKPDDAVWVLFYQQQERYAEPCAAGDMRCMPCELFGQRFFAYQETPKPKGN